MTSDIVAWIGRYEILRVLFMPNIHSPACNQYLAVIVLVVISYPVNGKPDNLGWAARRYYEYLGINYVAMRVFCIFCDR